MHFNHRLNGLYRTINVVIRDIHKISEQTAVEVEFVRVSARVHHVFYFLVFNYISFGGFSSLCFIGSFPLEYTLYAPTTIKKIIHKVF